MAWACLYTACTGQHQYKATKRGKLGQIVLGGMHTCLPVYDAVTAMVLHGRGWDSSVGRVPDLRLKGCLVKSPWEQRENFLVRS